MKTQAPLLSPHARGSFAKTFTALKQKRGGVLQIYHKPGGFPTGQQLFQRGRFNLARLLWSYFNFSEQNYYTTIANYKRLTNYQAFISDFSERYPSNHMEYGIIIYGNALFGA